MKVAAKGFQTFEQTGIVMNVSSTLHVDIKLTVGVESETVTVEATALALQVDSNVVSTLISSEQITSISTVPRCPTATRPHSSHRNSPLGSGTNELC